MIAFIDNHREVYGVEAHVLRHPVTLDPPIHLARRGDAIPATLPATEDLT